AAADLVEPGFAETGGADQRGEGRGGLVGGVEGKTMDPLIALLDKIEAVLRHHPGAATVLVDPRPGAVGVGQQIPFTALAVPGNDGDTAVFLGAGFLPVGDAGDAG